MPTLLQQLRYNTGPGPHFHAGDAGIGDAKPTVRAIAYYLPQFHPIKENNEWWGEGFTEWTNVTKALPQFEGHYQPHLPADLGFYDLRLPEAIKSQAKIARRYGIDGFCIHYYWFSGKRLLDSPLNTILEHDEIDISFCLNWANERWSRAWEDRPSGVLIDQEHSERDDEAFIDSIAPALRDRRYIRIGGRPLLMVYRYELFADPKATTDRWRALMAAKGLGEPFLVTAHIEAATQPDFDPRNHGFDAVAEFPPHKVGLPLPRGRDAFPLFDPRFRGSVRSYRDMVHCACNLAPAPFKVFRGVCMGWDNEARKPNRGLVFYGATPGLFGRWLRHACLEAVRDPDPDARIVFINAWNEWAEGTHLEPDRHFGHAYLVETASVLREVADGQAEQPDFSAAAGDGRRDRGLVAEFARRMRTKFIGLVRTLAESVAHPPENRDSQRKIPSNDE